MSNKLYKVYMALQNNKIILLQGLYIVSLDIKSLVYNIWFIDEFGIPKLFDCCQDKTTLQFKWNILMCKGGL